jgi:hypothetical protein
MLRYALVRRLHGEHLPHDTNTDRIRNIGIIAHVDAVRPGPDLDIGLALTSPREKQRQRNGCCITAD